MFRHVFLAVCILFAVHSTAVLASDTDAQNSPPKKIAYIVSDLRIPFWDIMWRGVKSKAEALSYGVSVYSADNDAKRELEHVAEVLKSGVDGLVISPTNSSATVTILKLAKAAGVPVAISDIGTDGGEYLTYISSDNEAGSYGLGRILVHEMIDRGWEEGRVGIIAIPQKRANGKARTNGFMRALNEAGIKGAGMRQQVTFSYQETYDYAADLINTNLDLRALWLQGSDRYQGALDAIKDAGKEGEVLLICFDAEPEFLDMIPDGQLVGAGMQQPFLMGEKAVEALDDHFNGNQVPKEHKLTVLAISKLTIQASLPTIRRNVLGLID
ncbi:substrate-binding domain-containing protein [Magnetovibrio blakemorei]|uniref:Sugar ABC transporter substrate-binding protein n=1 Tax=Magnetovibrio blakemorei TaxID=28181 RepID=A0A1E5Q2W3_9PROT|nr:substrate-binding domain-containing protein [Magnetovibrio blakemorei]OEJ63761.1 sugar ABC transporter substrate-binding protein [Magnetovibrio blakemorei]